jgi:restriction system protein
MEGFQVEQLGGAKADGGVDLIARRNGEKILVQCKHWQNWQVKAATIREMVGALKITGGDRMCVYTLNSSTDPAAQLASAQGIRIVTEREIVHRVESVGASRFADLLDPSKKVCPACDRPMVLRQGNFPSFWGCSRFPICREKIRIRPGSAAAGSGH